ncbi:MAG: DUF4373 domain-containing protein [Candidatus Nealsonbacteria bacterium]|nr:DUF4373 domain-containing protein [Candidatus Nealsonbacteria bacterium]
MKWFKHDTDAHIDLKIQSLISKHGVEAYGLYWICNELIGKENDKSFEIRAKNEWKIYISKQINIEEKKLEILLSALADCGLIDKKRLTKGILCNKKLQNRADEYTKKVRRMSGHSPDNVPPEENRTDKKRIEQIPFDEFWNLYDKKVGKSKSEKKWDKLSLEVQKKILEYIPNYKAAKPDKQFRKDPTTFFNNESWEDEIIGEKPAAAPPIPKPREPEIKISEEDRKKNLAKMAEMRNRLKGKLKA